MSIIRIEIYDGATEVARFDVDDFFWTTTKGSTYVPAQTSKADPVDGDATWTLTRLWDTANEYEFSSHVNRSLFKFKGDVTGSSKFDSDIEFEEGIPFTVAIAARRFWSGSDQVTIVDHMRSSGGWKMIYDGDSVVTTVSNTEGTVSLAWNETVSGRLGRLNLLVLRRNFSDGVFELLANGVIVDSVADTLTGDV
jgi:hypothetical protein